ncbi:hypothetical protein BC829DRAFT_417000 [Chytridium lagenaria]|nr:hypothetical protein BC829DRAFT_417000 [Chytridium lagenaria]
MLYLFFTSACHGMGVLSSSTKASYAFVEFEDPRDADDAYYEMQGRRFEGYPLTIQWARMHQAAAGATTAAVVTLGRGLLFVVVLARGSAGGPLPYARRERSPRGERSPRDRSPRRDERDDRVDERDDRIIDDHKKIDDVGRDADVKERNGDYIERNGDEGMREERSPERSGAKEEDDRSRDGSD